MNKLILLEHKVYKYKILEISLHLVHNCFLPFCNKYSNKISVIQSNMDIHFKNGHRVKFVEKKDYLNCHSSFFNTVIHDYIGKGLKQSQLTRNNPYKTHHIFLISCRYLADCPTLILVINDIISSLSKLSMGCDNYLLCELGKKLQI